MTPTETLNERFTFSSTEGRHLVRKILIDALPFEPHDDQVTGVSKTLDGVDILIVSATGSGKTGYFFMVLIVIIAINKNPQLCPSVTLKKDPAMIVLCPTNALEVDMKDKMIKFGLTAVALNRDTIEEAQRLRQEDLWETARVGIAVILTNTEQLSSRGFAKLTDDKTFAARLCALGVDEIHLLSTWGIALRPSLQQIGYVRARLPAVPLIGLTGTLCTGVPTTSVCRFLGLHLGQFFFLRRSNLRHDVQLLFRPMTSSLAGSKFPELDWVLRENEKVLIFIRTIHLGFRVALYLWFLSESGECEKRVRLYNSLNWPDYNDETRVLLHNEHDSQVVIATDTLSVGVDIPNFSTVVLFGDLPADTNELVQKTGRVGRKKRAGVQARAIIYYPRTAITIAQKVVASADGESIAVSNKGASSSGTMDVSMAKMLLAKCKPAAQNDLYDNPVEVVICSCLPCTTDPPCSAPVPCICSGCLPEWSNNTLATTTIIKEPTINPVPKKSRLTKVLRSHGTKRLERFRFEELFARADETATNILPPQVYLPDKTIQLLLDRFALLASVNDLTEIIGSNPLFATHHLTTLWDILITLRTEFDEIRLKVKEASAQKRQLAAKLWNAPNNPGLKIDPESTSDSSGSNSDDSVSDSAGLPKLRINFM